MAIKHYYEQKEHTKTYLIPFFKKYIPNFNNLKILEVGCAEGGFLDRLYELGIDAHGLELEPHRVKIAKEKNSNLKIITGDITDNKIVKELGTSFDFIVMRDVIEHIPDRAVMFSNIDQLLNRGGYMYIAFPPKYSAFAGHQQNCKSILRYIPYLHLLPNGMIRFLGKKFNENAGRMKDIISNYENGLTIKAFERYLKKYNFTPIVKDYFLFRPIYKIRFNLNPKKIPNIPGLRELITFGCEYLIIKK